MSEIENRRNLRELAFELAALTTLVDYLDDRRDALRAHLQTVASESGADATRALLSGDEVAKISIVNPKPKPVVLDDQKFFHHVKTFFPDEIQEVIRESFRKHFLERLDRTDDGAIDSVTGEFIDWIQYADPKPYVSTRFTPEGRSRIMAAFSDRSIALKVGDESEIQALS